MSQAVVRLDNAAVLNAAAKRIRGLLTNAASSMLDAGVELKKVRDTHFPIVPARKGSGIGRTGGRIRPGWATWLRDEFKISRAHADHLIKIGDRFAHRARTSSSLAALSGTVLKQLAYLPEENAIEAEVIEENKRSMRERGKPISVRKVKQIIRKRKREARGEKEPEPQLPSAKEAQKLAKAARERGEVVLIAARDGNLYTGADEKVVAEHERVRGIALRMEWFVDFMLKLDCTPHEFMEQTPEWLRWWRTKSERVSPKGVKVGEVARWFTAFAAAIERLR
ncbi:MAG: hypothetical protein C5B60_00175 [Chloroflexi bacterium]|nr:MAG: hypothetical protein C5B60_00175 [Chloroflexota bacterium]